MKVENIEIVEDGHIKEIVFPYSVKTLPNVVKFVIGVMTAENVPLDAVIEAFGIPTVNRVRIGFGDITVTDPDGRVKFLFKSYIRPDIEKVRKACDIIITETRATEKVVADFTRDKSLDPIIMVSGEDYEFYYIIKDYTVVLTGKLKDLKKAQNIWRVKEALNILGDEEIDEEAVVYIVEDGVRGAYRVNDYIVVSV